MRMKLSDDYFKPICDALGYDPASLTKMVITLEAGCLVVVEETRHLEETKEEYHP